MTILKQWLDEEFEASLGWNESVEGFIHKCSRLSSKFYKESQEDDNEQSPPGASELDDSSSGDSSSDGEDNISVVGI
eukprot:scaffold12124_cov137-Amphora_coffeaeformis.AAC.5